MKNILLALIVLMAFSGQINASKKENSYLRVNPKIKLGKYENGNHFTEVVLGKFNWHINQQFSVAGGASVGFTAPRSNAFRMNHYMNLLVLRATYRPPAWGNLGIFMEGGFSNLIDGSNNPVGYFRTSNPGGGSGNYQAIGIEIDWLEFTGG